MKVRYFLYNDFHNTKTSVTTQDSLATPPQVKAAKKRLCGVTGCTCGNSIGARGDINPTVIPHPDGSVTLFS